MYLPRDEKDSSMNLRRVSKPISAILLTVGLVALGVAPADAAPVHQAPTTSTNDTGWGFK
jgi:hypothetical protein